MAEELARIFGTEEDRVNCPWFFKTGACKNGDHCNRLHNRPIMSQTLLLRHMYPIPPEWMAVSFEEPWDDDMYDRAQAHFEEFFTEVFEELAKYGEIEDLVIVDNCCDHLIGNGYVKYYHEEAAEEAMNKLTGRFYKGRIIQVEYTTVSDFREGRCRGFHETRCKFGPYCQFFHIRHVPGAIKRRVVKEMYEEHPEYLEEKGWADKAVKKQRGGDDKEKKEKKEKKGRQEEGRHQKAGGRQRGENHEDYLDRMAIEDAAKNGGGRRREDRSAPLALANEPHDNGYERERRRGDRDMGEPLPDRRRERDDGPPRRQDFPPDVPPPDFAPPPRRRDAHDDGYDAPPRRREREPLDEGYGRNDRAPVRQDDEYDRRPQRGGDRSNRAAPPQEEEYRRDDRPARQIQQDDRPARDRGGPRDDYAAREQYDDRGGRGRGDGGNRDDDYPDEAPRRQRRRHDDGYDRNDQGGDRGGGGNRGGGVDYRVGDRGTLD